LPCGRRRTGAKIAKPQHPLEPPGRSGSGSSGGADELFSGAGAPALMSTKETALRLLRERYSESFALVPGFRANQVHLFLVKFGLWALVLTLTPRDYARFESSSEIGKALAYFENVFAGGDGQGQESLGRLDAAVSRAKERISRKAAEFNVRT
jgi:hypothetical protein